MINVIGFTILEIMVFIFVGEKIRMFNEDLAHAFYAYVAYKFLTESYRLYLAFRKMVIQKKMQSELESMFGEITVIKKDDEESTRDEE